MRPLHIAVNRYNLGMRDIGANLLSPQFKSDLPEVLARAHAAGVNFIDITGTSPAQSQQAMHLAQTDPQRLAFTAGSHPHNAASWRAEDLKTLSALLEHPQCLMCGEMGLDYARKLATPAEQERSFRDQLSLASDYPSKPLFLHCREAFEPFLAILDRAAAPNPVIVHCFTDGEREAKAFIERGWSIGITGWVSDARRNHALLGALPAIPIERLLLETDAPYLLPAGSGLPKGNRRNEPAFLGLVAQALSTHYGQSAEALGERCARNADALIGRPNPQLTTQIVSRAAITPK